MDFGEGNMGTAKAARRLWSSTAPDLSPLAGRTRQGFGGRSPEQSGCLGRREGQGPEEGVPGRRRPARRAVRPAYPERGGAGARRSRRRGRSRLQEPLETESPAAAAAAGGTHRQASGHRAAGADSFCHLQPKNGGREEVLLSPPHPDP
ncbi:guanine nucleotide-binding protein G(I)/G(S)/G(O) subunit gamma-12 isoform X2 [Ailuropoda melanoleuca]|uniref:guanine nucleotide-binding protein G(I)/G(S)/G(O) subunit gamma-12 isoform X2 n=1 Tax=Ailuropoda melanoleuca TaxID=9646 RepID=UPI00149408A3|nr:guanine nucleotide-binding protein G(I)/G(S)/G(O) subunit gamma-12 isoform X2 [Ailuropoda melanoleuca]